MVVVIGRALVICSCSSKSIVVIHSVDNRNGNGCCSSSPAQYRSSDSSKCRRLSEGVGVICIAALASARGNKFALGHLPCKRRQSKGRHRALPFAVGSIAAFSQANPAFSQTHARCNPGRRHVCRVPADPHAGRPARRPPPPRACVRSRFAAFSQF